MKKVFLITVFLIAGLAFQTNTNAQERFGFFYTSLAPYGSWIVLDNGVDVWRPNIMRSHWSPYRYGQWLWTNDGWYWDSYEPFGWITYHYGRWYYDDYYGWIWVPDDQWAPAWVEWRYDDNYIGWAPLPPYANFSIGLGIHFSVNFFTPYSHWHFVRYSNFCNPHISNYYISHKYVNNFFSKTKYRTNYGFQDGRVVNRGIDINIVRSRSGQNIRVQEIKAVSNPAELRMQDRNRSRTEIRTFIGSREEISRGDTRNIEFKRADRSSSLETSRIEIGRSRDINQDELMNRNNENRIITREPIPKVESRSIEPQNRSIQREREMAPLKVQPRTNVIEKRNEDVRINRETIRENKPVPQTIEKNREVRRENPPQQRRIERPSNGNSRNTNSSNGNPVKRR